MWNSLELECPVSDLVPYPPPDHYILENLRDFVTVLTTAADTLTSDSPLWNEINVLRNIQAKYKRILRCDRFLIFLHRVGHCLRKMVLLNLSKSYLDLAERLLLGFQDTSGTPHLPSRQQVEYVLIRTLSASRLVSEAITYSKESFCYLIQKLKIGHLILDLIMATSIVARLNILLRATLEQLSSMYKQVLYWRYKIKKGEFQWAEKVDLPQNVEEWIKSFNPAYMKPLSMSKEDIVRVKSMLTQMGINNKRDVSDTESIVLVDEVTADSPTPDIFIVETDFGDLIPRTIDDISQKSSRKKKVKINEKSVKKRKVEANHNITDLQKASLQKILNVQSLQDLENLWYDIIGSSHERFPGILTAKIKAKVNKLFSELKITHPLNEYSKSYKKKPEFFKIALIHVCTKLGFTKGHIALCKKVHDPDPEPLESDSSDEIKMLDTSRPLLPVRSIKKLRLLYEQLTEILEFNNEREKLKSLKEIFNHRITHIKCLRDNGKRKLSKKLTYCTSKEFLALYQ